MMWKKVLIFGGIISVSVNFMTGVDARKQPHRHLRSKVAARIATPFSNISISITPESEEFQSQNNGATLAPHDSKNTENIEDATATKEDKSKEKTIASEDRKGDEGEIASEDGEGDEDETASEDGKGDEDETASGDGKGDEDETASEDGEGDEDEKASEGGKGDEDETASEDGEGDEDEKASEDGEGDEDEKASEGGEGDEDETASEDGKGDGDETASEDGEGDEDEKASEDGEGDEDETASEDGKGDGDETASEDGEGDEDEKASEDGEGDEDETASEDGKGNEDEIASEDGEGDEDETASEDGKGNEDEIASEDSKGDEYEIINEDSKEDEDETASEDGEGDEDEISSDGSKGENAKKTRKKKGGRRIITTIHVKDKPPVVSPLNETSIEDTSEGVVFVFHGVKEDINDYISDYFSKAIDAFQALGFTVVTINWSKFAKPETNEKAELHNLRVAALTGFLAAKCINRMDKTVPIFLIGDDLGTVASAMTTERAHRKINFVYGTDERHLEEKKFRYLYLRQDMAELVQLIHNNDTFPSYGARDFYAHPKLLRKRNTYDLLLEDVTSKGKTYKASICYSRKAYERRKCRRSPTSPLFNTEFPDGLTGKYYLGSRKRG